MNTIVKTLILPILLSCCCMTAKAQSYRGFVDAHFGVNVTNSDNNDDTSVGGGLGDNWSTYGVTTTHGVQLRNFFIGAGAGILMTTTAEAVSIPVFGEARYDFFNTRLVNFFLGCRLGYLKSCADTSDTENAYVESNFYWEPRLGIRFRISDKLGVNLALSYIPTKWCNKGGNFEIYDDKTNSFVPVVVDDVKGSINYLSLSVGLEF